MTETTLPRSGARAQESRAWGVTPVGKVVSITVLSGWWRKIKVFGLYFFREYGIALVWSMKYGLFGDERIGSLRDEVERLREEVRRRERDANKLQQENDRQKRHIDGLRRQDERQKREIEDLKRQLATARRAGFRQAALFAKNRPQRRGRRPGRRAGALYGRRTSRRRPERVDQTLEAPVSTTCPDCGGLVEVTHVASQYQEEIPEVRPVVRRFDIEVRRCSQCQRRVQGRHALQTSDALGAAGVQLGPGVGSVSL